MALQRLKLIEVEEDGNSTITYHDSFKDLKEHADKKIGKVDVIAQPEEAETPESLAQKDPLVAKRAAKKAAAKKSAPPQPTPATNDNSSSEDNQTTSEDKSDNDVLTNTQVTNQAPEEDKTEQG